MTSINYTVLAFAIMLFMANIIYGEKQKANSEYEGMYNSISDSNERLEYEKRILNGLKILLNSKERRFLADQIEKSELIAQNENLIISRETSKYGATLFTVNANLVPLNEILNILAITSGRRLIIDDDIDKKEIYSIVSVFLEHTPLADIIDIILAAKGLESILSEDIIFATIPGKLNVISPFDFYQEKAIQAYQRAMIKYPEYKDIARAYFELGNFYFTSGFPTIALQEYKIISEKYPDHTLAKTAMIYSGKCYEILGDMENAKQIYLNYARKYPNDPKTDDAYLIVGNLFRKQKKYNKAIEIYNFIIGEFPKEITAKRAHIQMGYAYIESEEYALALKTFEEFKAKNLGSKYRHEIEFQIGNCNYLAGNYNDAIEILGEFILYEQENDLLDDAYYKLADCFFKMEDYVTSSYIYHSTLSEYPDSNFAPYGYYSYGNSLRLTNMLESAKKALRKGLDKYPDSIYANKMKFEIGLCYFEDESYNLAFDVFKNINSEKDPANLHIYQANIYSGICLSRKNLHKEAIENYYKAFNDKITEKERNWVFRLIGDSYTELGNFAKATMAYQGEIM